MSLDRSLKSGAGLGRHRNVLTRGERVARLKSEGLWQEGQSVLHLAKVGNRKKALGKKGGAKKDDADTKAAAPAADAKK